MLYTFGCGSGGRLGHIKTAHKFLYKERLPRVVGTFEGRFVEDVDSSYYHMIAIVNS